MKNYRSSIPKVAQERVVATYLKNPHKYKAEYALKGEIVESDTLKKNGNLMSETPVKNGVDAWNSILLRPGTCGFL